MDCKFERGWATAFSEEGSFQVLFVSGRQQQSALISKQGTKELIVVSCHAVETDVAGFVTSALMSIA